MRLTFLLSTLITYNLIFALSYCITDLPDHERILCEEYLPGAIDAIALLQPDVVVPDYEDGDTWQPFIDAGTLKIIDGVRAEFPDATITEVDSPVGGGSPIISGMKFQLNVLDYNSTEANDDFWATANGQRYKLVWREPKNGIIKVIEQIVTVKSTPVMVPGDDQQLQRHNIVISGNGRKNFHPVRYNEPDGIFEAVAA